MFAIGFDLRRRLTQQTHPHGGPQAYAALGAVLN